MNKFEMNKQTEAERLADILANKIPSIECLEKSAAELRSLSAINAELVEALDKCQMLFTRDSETGSTDENGCNMQTIEQYKTYLKRVDIAKESVKAALEKAKQ